MLFESLIGLDFAGKGELALPIDDPLTESLDHRASIAGAQVEFLGDLQTGEIQAHKVQANDPGSQGFMMSREDRPGEVVEAMSAGMTLVALPVGLGLVSAILDDVEALPAAGQ